jgi:hypothetical protein
MILAQRPGADVKLEGGCAGLQILFRWKFIYLNQENDLLPRSRRPFYSQPSIDRLSFECLVSWNQWQGLVLDYLLAVTLMSRLRNRSFIAHFLSSLPLSVCLRAH